MIYSYLFCVFRHHRGISWNNITFHSFICSYLTNFTKFFDIRMFLNSVELFWIQYTVAIVGTFHILTKFFDIRILNILLVFNLKPKYIDRISIFSWNFFGFNIPTPLWGFLYYHNNFFHKVTLESKFLFIRSAQVRHLFIYYILLFSTSYGSKIRQCIVE